MKGYQLGKDVQQIKDGLRRLEQRLGGSPQTADDDGGAIGSTSPLGERTYCVLANHTFRDIHIQVTGDVHTGNWGPNQVNHNEEPEVKSKSITFGNEATYHIKVWNNNGGQPGDFIGEFDHKVRYNAGGNRDHLEFAIVDVDGTTYLRAFSVRKAIEIALLLWIGARSGKSAPKS